MGNWNWALCATAASAVAACASSEDLRAMRRPPLPPDHVALVDRGMPLREAIAVYEINGAPEFRLLDEGGLIVTRPTRADVSAMLRAWLGDARMLAPDIAHADYLLTVEFVDLRGPDVIPFSDKTARATIRYQLRNRRTDAVLFEQTYEAALNARMPGMTPEMVRAALTAGLVGAALGPDIASSGDPASTAAAAGGLLGADSAAFAWSHDTLLWDLPEALLSAPPRLADGLGLGIVIGGYAGSGDYVVGDVAARTRGAAAGAAIGLLAAAPDGGRAEEWDAPSAPGAFWGAERRRQAVEGMMRQNFNRFLFGLADARLITIREAVTCDELHPRGLNVGVITSNQTQVAYDCPIGRTRPID
jgi:hypothetical protein